MKIRHMLLSAFVLSVSAMIAQNVTIKLQGRSPLIYPASELEFIKFDDAQTPAGDEFNILTPEYMPDENLRACIMDIFELEEENLSNIDAAKYTGWITISNGDVKSAKGLEYFTSIPYLAFNSCKSLDVTTLPELPNVTYFNLSFCSLPEFDVFHYFPNLTKLLISGNKFKNYAPVSDKLLVLGCEANYMESLDVSGCPNLQELSAGQNRLTQLNIGTSPLKELIVKDNAAIGAVNFDHARNTLQLLNVSNTGITSLDVHDCYMLQELECQENSLVSTPNLNGCVSLKRLRLEHTGISELDLSTMLALEELHCYGNNIKKLDMSGLAGLKFVNAFSNPLTWIDVNGCGALEHLHVSGTELEYVDLSDCSGSLLEEFFCEYNPDLKEVKVWAEFDLTAPPTQWYIQDGAKYVYEFSGDVNPGGGEDPEEKTYKVKFNFTNPGTENCVYLTANFEKVDAPMTTVFEFAEGTTVAVIQDYTYVIDAVELNGVPINWAGYKYVSLTEDLEFTITAHVAPKVSTTLTIDNAAAISFEIEGEPVQLVNGENTIEFFERKNSASFTVNEGYKVTNLKIGGWGYSFNETGTTEISLNEGEAIVITTASIE